MSDLYAYIPEFCDGDICPMNCDNYHKREMQPKEEKLMIPWIYADLDTIIDCYSEPPEEET